MERVVQGFTDALISSGAIQEECDIYEYGLDLALYTILSIGLIIIGGAVFGHLRPITGWILTFSLLQSCCGGYHAKTHARCFTTMVIAGILAMIAWHHLPLTYCVPLSAIASIVIGFLAPVEHENAPMSTTKKKRLSMTGRMLTAVLFAAVFLSRTGLPTLATSVSLGMVSSALSILYATLAHRCNTERCMHHESP